MRIAMLSWEFPPLLVGGLASHVDGLARAMARADHEVVVLTLHHPDVPDDYQLEGVRVLRARADLPWLPPDNFLAQMSSANHQLVKLGARLDGWVPDVVHAHDWLVAWAGDTLGVVWDRPLVATVHATERGRHGGGGLPPGQPQGIHAVEWWLTYQARRVVAASQFMVDEITGSFSLPRDKIDLIPNGVDPLRWGPDPQSPGRGSLGPLIVTWGRLQYEKGFQTLIEAMPAVRRAVPDARCIVAGRGSYGDELGHLAGRLGVGGAIDFAGFVSDDHLRSLLHMASCAVIPSLYEPFGIVALEAMAAGAPLVAAASGGLAEVLGDTEAGLLFRPGDVGDLAAKVIRLLTDPVLAEACQNAATTMVHDRYSWDAIAAETLRTYDRAGAVSERP